MLLEIWLNEQDEQIPALSCKLECGEAGCCETEPINGQKSERQLQPVDSNGHVSLLNYIFHKLFWFFCLVSLLLLKSLLTLCCCKRHFIFILFSPIVWPLVFVLFNDLRRGFMVAMYTPLLFPTPPALEAVIIFSIEIVHNILILNLNHRKLFKSPSIHQKLNNVKGLLFHTEINSITVRYIPWSPSIGPSFWQHTGALIYTL